MASALPIRVLAWEITRRCPMACVHCRGAAKDEAYADELTTREAFRVIDSLHEADCHPLIIFTGGEPMCRDDLEELVRYATEKQFPCVLAPCGRFVTEERLSALKTAGVRALSISVDGVDAQAHDAFRGVPGAFDIALRAMEVARHVRLPFQINHCVGRCMPSRKSRARRVWTASSSYPSGEARDFAHSVSPQARPRTRFKRFSIWMPQVRFLCT